MHGVALSSCWLAVRKTCWNQPQRSNARLRVDVRTLQVCFSQRTMSFVYFDVLGRGCGGGPGLEVDDQILDLYCKTGGTMACARTSREDTIC